MLNGVAPAIQGALQADAVIGVTGNVAAPAMCLINDRPEFFHRQRRLRHQRALLIDPGAVRHVHLDPVGAVIKLLAGRLARFNRPVDQLRSLGHEDLRRVALEVVAPGGGDGARRHEHARARDVAFVDRLLDADVTVARALGLDVADAREPLLERPTRCYHGACRPIGCRVLEQLYVVAPGGRILTLQEDVGVTVDEARQHGRGAQIDYLRSGGNRAGPLRAYLDNAVAADEDFGVVPRFSVGAVDERAGAHQNFCGRGG